MKQLCTSDVFLLGKELYPNTLIDIALHLIDVRQEFTSVLEKTEEELKLERLLLKRIFIDHRVVGELDQYFYYGASISIESWLTLANNIRTKEFKNDDEFFNYILLLVLRPYKGFGRKDLLEKDTKFLEILETFKTKSRYMKLKAEPLDVIMLNDMYGVRDLFVKTINYLFGSKLYSNEEIIDCLSVTWLTVYEVMNKHKSSYIGINYDLGDYQWTAFLKTPLETSGISYRRELKK